MPSRKAFPVSQVHLDDRKVCWWLRAHFLSLGVCLFYGTVILAFLPWFPTPQVLSYWKCSLQSYRNLEPCDLKMQSHVQSVVVKGRVHCLLPGYNDCLHLRITKYLGYPLFNPHRIGDTVFATYCWFSSPTLPASASTVSKAKAVFYLPLESPQWMNCTSHDRIWGWIRNRMLSDCSLSYFSFTKKEEIKFPCDCGNLPCFPSWKKWHSSLSIEMNLCRAVC